MRPYGSFWSSFANTTAVKKGLEARQDMHLKLQSLLQCYFHLFLIERLSRQSVAPYLHFGTASAATFKKLSYVIICSSPATGGVWYLSSKYHRFWNKNKNTLRIDMIQQNEPINIYCDEWVTTAANLHFKPAILWLTILLNNIVWPNQKLSSLVELSIIFTRAHYMGRLKDLIRNIQHCYNIV